MEETPQERSLKEGSPQRVRLCTPPTGAELSKLPLPVFSFSV